MPLTQPIRIRQSDEAVWVEDAAGLRCCYTYFTRDETMLQVRQRWRYDDAVAIVRAVARALSTAPLATDSEGDAENSPM